MICLEWHSSRHYIWTDATSGVPKGGGGFRTPPHFWKRWLSRFFQNSIKSVTSGGLGWSSIFWRHWTSKLLNFEVIERYLIAPCCSVSYILLAQQGSYFYYRTVIHLEFHLPFILFWGQWIEFLDEYKTIIFASNTFSCDTVGLHCTMTDY